MHEIIFIFFLLTISTGSSFSTSTKMMHDFISAWLLFVLVLNKEELLKKLKPVIPNILIINICSA